MEKENKMKTWFNNLKVSCRAFSNKVSNCFKKYKESLTKAFAPVTKVLKPVLGNRIVQSLLPVLFLVLMFVIFIIATGGKILKPITLQNILNQALITAVVATGAAFIFATGNVNIAMGSSVAITCSVTAKIYLATGSIPLMFVTAIVFGVVLLLLCSLLSVVLKVRVMFVTIVMMVLLQAIHETIVGAGQIEIPVSVLEPLDNAGVIYILFALFVAAAIIIFHFTSVGRKLKMIGSNELCSRQTGISKNAGIITAFIIAGVGVGVGALLTIIRTGSIGTSTAGKLNMDCMLAIVLGGMPVFGGAKSKAYASIIGAFTVTLLSTGLLMIGVSNDILQLVRGVIFIVLVIIGNKRSALLPAREG